MLKKIQAKDLKLGMYVVKLDASWFKHPFFFSKQRLIEDPVTIKQILAYGIETVWIDPERGLDVSQLKPAVPEPKPEIKVQPRVEPPEEIPQKPLRDFGKELAVAQSLYSETIGLVKDFMSDARAGRAIDYEKGTAQVDEIIKSVLRNPSALISLTKLRTRDEYTYTHCVNVSTLAVAYGNYRRFDQEKLSILGAAGLYHDIGKTKIPDAILNKPARLTPEEFKVIQNHSLYGYDIMRQQYGVPLDVLQGIVEHHERPDGKGYPRGLKDDEIGWCGKILGMVDVYDAMTSKRVYHNPMLPTAVLQNFYKERNEHFSASEVEHFIKCLGIFPPGSFVLLSSGESGVVREISNETSHKPSIKIIYNKRMKPISPRVLDLADPESCKPHENLEIIGYIDPKLYGIDIEKFLS